MKLTLRLPRDADVHWINGVGWYTVDDRDKKLARDFARRLRSAANLIEEGYSAVDFIDVHGCLVGSAQLSSLGG